MKNTGRNIIVFFVIFCLSVLAFGQASSLVERLVDVQTKEKNPGIARSILMNQASEKVSEELILEIVGEQKYQKNRSLILNKVVKKSAAYLPFIKSGDLKEIPPEQGGGYQLSLSVKANLDLLQNLLLENGLFYDESSLATVLPFIQWQDQVQSKNFSWWTQDGDDKNKVFLAKQSRLLEQVLQDSFLRTGFFIMKPQVFGFDSTLSSEHKSESLNSEVLSQLTLAFSAQILLQGKVGLTKAERADAVAIEVRLTATQSLNGRILAEVARKFETESGVFESVVDRKLAQSLPAISADLSSQLLEAWKQGTINSQLYKLKILGRIDLLNQESLKEGFRSKVREIKSIKERLISSEEIVYEIDSSISPIEVAKKLNELELKNTTIILDRSSEQEVVYKIKR